MTITVREYDDSDANPLYPQMYMTVPGTDDFRLVASYDDGGGYDWTNWAAWYSPARRRYFIASGSGCSCNSLGDDYHTLGDFETVATKEAVKESFRQFIDNRYEYTELRNRPRLDDQYAEINKFEVKA